MSKISLFSRIRLKQYATYLLLPTLAVLITLGVTTDLFRTNKTVKAVEITGDTIPAGLNNQDIIINGSTVYLDNQAVFQESFPAKGETAGATCTGTSNPNCDTKRTFRNLTLINGAVLTHHEISARDTSVIGETTGIDRWRKVDLELTGYLDVQDTSRIDVDGKGYPGGVQSHREGYGPNGGYGILGSALPGGIGGNGGGNKGYGGQGYCYQGALGTCITPTTGSAYRGVNPDQTNSTDTEFEPGSGGGAAVHSSPAFVTLNGGAGGGRIKIKANGNIRVRNNARITAEGLVGESSVTGLPGTTEYRIAGSGAGGSILLYAGTFTFNPSNAEADRLGLSADGGSIVDYQQEFIYKEDSTIHNANVFWDDIEHSAGSDGKVVNTTDQLITNISARGGSGYYSNSNTFFSGGGGGGEVKVIDISDKYNIYKHLEAVARGGVSNTTFNPYALQQSDEIKVWFTVSNLEVGETFTIRDDNLKTQGANPIKCVPTTGSVVIGSGTKVSEVIDLVDDYVELVITAKSNEVTISYNCVVQ